MEEKEDQVGLREPIEKHFPFVRVVVGQLIKTMNLPADYFEEYYSAGIMGLLEAAERYESELNPSFERFAYSRVRGAIVDCLREMSGVSFRAYRYGRAIKAFDDLVANSEAPDFGDQKAQLAGLLDLISKGGLIFKMSVEEAPELPTQAEAHKDQPDYQYQQYSSLSLIRDLIGELPEIERDILVQHYYEDKNFAEIADASDTLSRSWVSRLHKRAINRLRQVYLKRVAYDS